jgi:hypothetical protein
MIPSPPTPQPTSTPRAASAGFDDGLATRPDALARRRIGTFADGTVHDRTAEADQRRAA